MSETKECSATGSVEIGVLNDALGLGVLLLIIVATQLVSAVFGA